VGETGDIHDKLIALDTGKDDNATDFVEHDFNTWYNHLSTSDIPLVLSSDDPNLIPAGRYDLTPLVNKMIEDTETIDTANVTSVSATWEENNIYLTYSLDKDKILRGFHYDFSKTIDEYDTWYGDRSIFFVDKNGNDYYLLNDNFGGDAWESTPATYYTAPIIDVTGDISNKNLKDLFKKSGILSTDGASINAYKWTRTKTETIEHIGAQAKTTYTYTNAQLMESDARIVEWCKNSDTTRIDGGKIFAHSLSADVLGANAIRSLNYPSKLYGEGINGSGANYAYIDVTDEPYDGYRDNELFPESGSFLNLANGEFFTPGFKVYQGAGGWKSEFKGTIIADSGQIAGWDIRTDALAKTFEITKKTGQKETYTVTLGAGLYNPDGVWDDETAFDNSTSFHVGRLDENNKVIDITYIRPSGFCHFTEGEIGPIEFNASGIGVGADFKGTKITQSTINTATV
jgi:hypothetical protein